MNFGTDTAFGTLQFILFNSLPFSPPFIFFEQENRYEVILFDIADTKAQTPALYYIMVVIFFIIHLHTELPGEEVSGAVSNFTQSSLPPSHGV